MPSTGKIPDIPYVVSKWRREHPDEQMPDGLILTQPWPAGPADKRRDQVIYYQYKADRARRAQRGIDEQVAKAEKGGGREVPVKSQPVHRARRRRQVREPQVTVTARRGQWALCPGWAFCRVNDDERQSRGTSPLLSALTHAR